LFNHIKKNLERGEGGTELFTSSTYKVNLISAESPEWRKEAQEVHAFVPLAFWRYECNASRGL